MFIRNNVKKFYLLVAIFLSITLGSNSAMAAGVSQDKEGQHHTEVLKIKNRMSASQLVGNWVEESYLTSLEQRKNIEAIYCYNELPYLRITKNDKEYSLLRSIGFHEGINAKIVKINLTSKAGNIEVVLQEEGSTEYKKELWHLSNFNNKFGKITITDENKNKTMYIRINCRPEEYVNQLLLAGNYKDENGKSYMFQANQTAVWPDHSFEYEVILDSEAGDHDYGYYYQKTENSKSGTIFYGYKIKGHKLYLYNVKVDESGRLICTEPSFLVLNKEK